MYSTFWISIAVVLSECRTGSLSVRIDYGRCNVDFYNSCLCCSLYADGTFSIGTDILLLLVLLSDEECPLFLLFWVVLWNSVFYLNFFQFWFLLLEEKLQAAETVTFLGKFLWFYGWLILYSSWLYSHGPLLQIISTGITRSVITKCSIFLTSKERINLVN